MEIADIIPLIRPFLATFFISRLLLWFVLKWDGGALKIIAAHIVSLIVIGALSFLGAVGGEKGLDAALLFVAACSLPQLLWMAIDLWRMRSGRPPILVSSSG